MTNHAAKNLIIFRLGGGTVDTREDKLKVSSERMTKLRLLHNSPPSFTSQANCAGSYPALATKE